MGQVTVIGVDLAKNTFYLHGNDARGNCVLRRNLSRRKFAEFLAKHPPVLIGMEACGGAHYWGRKAIEFGHRVKLMGPQHVKPFVTSNKNDSNDAAGCAEAATRTKILPVPLKTRQQLDIQALHRIRERRIRARTALINEIRGLAGEHGVVAPQGRKGLERLVQEVLNTDLHVSLSEACRTTIADLAAELRDLDDRICADSERVDRHVASDERCRRLMKIPGIGPVSASAMVASAAVGPEIRNGRHFSARLGLVPRHSGTGGKSKILGLSKRGDSYLRYLLIHGARAAVTRSNPGDPMVDWAKELRLRRGLHKATAALANKMARVIFRMLSEDEVYDPGHFSRHRTAMTR